MELFYAGAGIAALTTDKVPGLYVFRDDKGVAENMSIAAGETEMGFTRVNCI